MDYVATFDGEDHDTVIEYVMGWVDIGQWGVLDWHFTHVDGQPVTRAESDRIAEMVSEDDILVAIMDWEAE